MTLQKKCKKFRVKQQWYYHTHLGKIYFSKTYSIFEYAEPKYSAKL